MDRFLDRFWRGFWRGFGEVFGDNFDTFLYYFAYRVSKVFYKDVEVIRIGFGVMFDRILNDSGSLLP